MSDKLVGLAMSQYINDNNKMTLYLLLMGRGPIALEAYPGAGHNYYTIMNSIYDYQVNNPSVDVGLIFQNVLDFCGKKVTTARDFEMTMNYVFAQLENEKRNVSPFKIDILSILNDLKVRINTYEGFKGDDLMTEVTKTSDQYFRRKLWSQNFMSC